MKKDKIVEKIADRAATLIFHEIDHYMEELGFEETNDEWMNEVNEVFLKVIKELGR